MPQHGDEPLYMPPFPPTCCCTGSLQSAGHLHGGGTTGAESDPGQDPRTAYVLCLTFLYFSCFLSSDPNIGNIVVLNAAASICVCLHRNIHSHSLISLFDIAGHTSGQLHYDDPSISPSDFRMADSKTRLLRQRTGDLRILFLVPSDAAYCYVYQI